jgi:hypothetical protein
MNGLLIFSKKKLTKTKQVCQHETLAKQGMPFIRICLPTQERGNEKFISIGSIKHRRLAGNGLFFKGFGPPEESSHMD